MNTKGIVLWRSSAVPILTWASSTALVCAVAAARSLSPFDPATWSRWDSRIYLSIAATGYHFSNSACLPLYPWLIRCLGSIGLPLPWGGVVLSNLFQLAALAVLWNGFLAKAERPQALLLMAAAAVFPGMIYEHAVSSVSLLTFLILCHLLLLIRARPGLACLTGIAAGMTHGAGIFLAPAVAVWICVHWRRNGGRRTALAAAALSPLIGLAIVLVVQRLQTGAWDSGAKALEFHRYGPWSMVRLSQMLYIPVVFHPTEWTKAVVLVQSAVVAALCLAAALRRRNERGADLILICAWVFWIAPHLSLYRHSYYRVETYLLPLLALFGSLPKRALIPLLALFAVLAAILADQFFRGILV
jgi:hypothetical protein